MMTLDLHTATPDSKNAKPPDRRPSTTKRGSSLRAEGSFLPPPGVVVGSFDVRSFELMRRFVEYVVAQNECARLGNGHRARHIIDWAAVEASVADSRTLEQAIGRAVVLADQISRGVFDDLRPGDSPSSFGIDEPFFAFSMAGVTPDFGDESRYRTRLAKRATRMFPNRRRTTAAPATAGVLAAAAPLATTVTEPAISAS
jgi:hypothetical protein